VVGSDLEKRLLLLTGNPGIGKTTVLLQVAEGLKAKGCSVGGMISLEVRSCEERVGFEILDLVNGRRGWLAHVGQKSGPQVGRYRVNLENLDSVGVAAIDEAVESADVVAIDEVGPMELLSKRFREAVRRAVGSQKPVVSVVHWRVKDRLIDEVKKREDAETIEVKVDNRDKLHKTLVEKVAGLLSK
jgi:nucleoside-triphosphatase